LTLLSHLESWEHVAVRIGEYCMARIRPLEHAQAEPAARAELDRQVAAGGRVTNMKRTLAHSPVALQALISTDAVLKGRPGR
jgi:hypothetical protein